jgi:precorrin-6B methylase 2
MSTNPDRRMYLGMPGYGKQTASAGRALWNASRDMSKVTVEYAPGSLLACNFNKLWCSALNMVHSGKRVDYFAMLHDDIGCQDFWLDELIEELEAKHLDVLGVVVPIKDTRGITSIAIHYPGDNWNPACRLSMHDVYQLPETFTSDDLGGQQLLLNTGCWVAKWNQEWCRQVHFEINDRIVFDQTTNAYWPEVESEDWFFSRLLHEQQLSIGATRKIAVKHEGDVEFSNTFPWGSQAFDSESKRRKTSPVPGAFPMDIAGWLLREEGAKLAELAAGKRVLEIGSYCGLSTVCLARTAEHVTAVDYFDGRGTHNRRDTLPEFKANIERYGVAHKIEAKHPSWLDKGELPRPEFDLVFIDGAHDFKSVQADIIHAQNHLAPDGLIVFHDYSTLTDFEVVQAVDAFLADGAELISVTETLAVVRPPAAIPLEV